MLMWTVLYVMAVFLAMLVMPFSRSRSMESIIRSGPDSFWRKSPDCQSMASTSVVLPWSTWAMIAMLRIVSRCRISPSYHVGNDASVPPMRPGDGAAEPARGSVGTLRQLLLRLSLPLPALHHPLPRVPLLQLRAPHSGPPRVRPAAGARAADPVRRR